MQPDSRCRSCNAPIRWGVSEQTGKRMPIDPDPIETGNVLIVRYDNGLPVFSVHADHLFMPEGEPLRYQSHFVTCPDAQDWRR